MTETTKAVLQSSVIGLTAQESSRTATNVVSCMKRVVHEHRPMGTGIEMVGGATELINTEEERPTVEAEDVTMT